MRAAGSALGAGRRWVVLAALAHLLLALGVQLSPDEAHYALYAQHLAWSYFDHPPLVGWVQWPAWVLGGSDVALRVVPMLCWLLAAWGLGRLVPAFGGLDGAGGGSHGVAGGAQSAGALALLLWLLSPLPHLLGFALVPDTLLLPLTVAIMGLSLQLRRPGAPLRSWLLLGLCLGLAGLSKYTAIFLGLGAAIVLLQGRGWALLRESGLWLAVLLALLLIVPVLAWNASHDWISFAYQAGHAAGQREWRVSRVAGYALVQVLAFGVLPLLGLLLAARALRHRASRVVMAQQGSGEVQSGQAAQAARGSVVAPSTSTVSGSALSLSLLFGAAYGGPVLLLLLYLSGRGSTLPHWTAFAWLAWLPAAGWGCLQLGRAWRRGLMGWQMFCCVGLAALMLAGGISTEEGAQQRSGPGELTQSAPRNPFADLHGWQAAARRATELAQAQGVGTLGVMNWSLASRIAWYARPLPVKVVRRHFDQFDLWFGPLRRGDSMILVDWSLMSFTPPVAAGEFADCRLLESQPQMHAGRQLGHFNFLLCRNWQSDAEVRRGF